MYAIYKYFYCLFIVFSFSSCIASSEEQESASAQLSPTIEALRAFMSDEKLSKQPGLMRTIFFGDSPPSKEKKKQQQIAKSQANRLAKLPAAEFKRQLMRAIEPPKLMDLREMRKRRRVTGPVTRSRSGGGGGSGSGGGSSEYKYTVELPKWLPRLRRSLYKEVDFSAIGREDTYNIIDNYCYKNMIVTCTTTPSIRSGIELLEKMLSHAAYAYLDPSESLANTGAPRSNEAMSEVVNLWSRLASFMMCYRALLESSTKDREEEIEKQHRYIKSVLNEEPIYKAIFALMKATYTDSLIAASFNTVAAVLLIRLFRAIVRTNALHDGLAREIAVVQAELNKLYKKE